MCCGARGWLDTRVWQVHRCDLSSTTRPVVRYRLVRKKSPRPPFRPVQCWGGTQILVLCTSVFAPASLPTLKTGGRGGGTSCRVSRAITGFYFARPGVPMFAKRSFISHGRTHTEEVQGSFGILDQKGRVGPNEIKFQGLHMDPTSLPHTGLVVEGAFFSHQPV